MTALVPATVAAKIEVGPQCWQWRGAVDRLGYGKVAVNGRHWLAHRFVFDRLVGGLTVGLELDHLCRNPGCVRPEHLEQVTHRENLLRGMSRAGIGPRTNACMKGHAHTPENTYFGRQGRKCRACARERDARRGWRRPGRGLPR